MRRRTWRNPNALSDYFQLSMMNLLCSSVLFLALGTFLVPSEAVNKGPGGMILECRNETHRPRLHFSPRFNWINDPNGMVYYAGEYHLHYQYYPEGTNWGPMHWGHAVSPDSIHWTELDIALYPDELGMIFSGSAIVDLDNSTGFQPPGSSEAPLVAIFTHAGTTQQQSLAYSLDKGRSYIKYPGNPVIPNTDIVDFRDPKVTRVGSDWVLVLAAGDRIMFYSSPDLKSWTYLSSFGGDPPQGSHGGVWECPDLVSFELAGETHWVLIVSINPGGPNSGSVTQYFVGQWTGSHFISDQTEPLWMDWGIDNYAGVTYFNEPLNRVMYMAWMNQWLYAAALPTGHFKGQMTIPRVLSLTRVPNVGLRLASSFASEITSLRDPAQKYESVRTEDVAPNAMKQVPLPFSNPLMEIDLSFNITGLKGTSSLAVCLVNDVAQELCFGYDLGRPKDTEVFLNRELTGDLGAISGSFRGRLVAGRVSDLSEINFKAVVDIAGIELLIDDGLTAMTAVYFPSKPLNMVEIRHHAQGASDSKLTVNRVSVQGLNSIYPCN